MLYEVTVWLVDIAKELWEFFLNGGYIGMAIILFPIVRRLVSVMKQFTS